MKKLLVVQAAALGRGFAECNGMSEVGGLSLAAADSVFPAVTCVASASFRTGLGPDAHGISANGFLDRELREPCFWKQHAGLVKGARFWDGFRARGGTVAAGFIQQLLGERVDAAVSPAPIHKHGGGMVMSCYSDPPRFYKELAAGAGSDFKLWRYWGPLASAKASRWIASGFARYLASPEACDLVWCYLPALDYDLQRFGPDSPPAHAAALELRRELELLLRAASENDYRVLVFGDYEIEEVTLGPAYLNRALRAAGLMRTREVAGMEYPDLYASRAFAVCDHQVAEIEVFDDAARARAEEVVAADPVVERLIPHERSFTAVARRGAWFAYPWWTDAKRAPDYAVHVDIHNKPGFDPCELFFGWPNPFHSSTDAAKVRGTHGRGDQPVAVFTDLPYRGGDFRSLTRLAADFLAAGN